MKLIMSKYSFYKWKNILSSRHFCSSFFSVSLFTTIMFLTGGIYITLANTGKLRETLEMKADHAALSVQEWISNMKYSAVFIGNLPSVNRVMNAKSPTVDQLSGMINDITPYASIYPYENIWLFFRHSSRIFDSGGGMYHYDDFYDQDLLAVLDNMEREELWLINVPYKRYYSPRPALSVVMYIRKLPLYQSECYGYVAVSCSLQQLQNIASDALTSSPYTAFLSFQDQLLWASSDSADECWDSGRTFTDNIHILFPGAAIYSSSSAMDVVCAFSLTWHERFAVLFPALLYWFFLYPAAILVVFAGSVLYSLLMVRPVDELMKKIGIVPYTESSPQGIDEYTALSTALDNLNTRMSGLNMIIHENQRLVWERLLSGILYNHVDICQLPLEYKENGIEFPYPYYAVILMSLPSLDEMENYPGKEQLRLFIRTNATNAFSVLGIAYSLYIDDNRVCILVNTSHFKSLQEELTKICTALKQRIKKNLSVYPLFSIGICKEEDPKPWQAWQLARKNAIFTADDADDFICFGFQNEFTSSINPKLLTYLSQAVLDKDRDALNHLIEIFQSRYLDHAVLSEGQRISIIALCHVYTSLLDVNVELPDNSLNVGIRKLEQSASIEECSRNFYACLLGLTDTGNKISPETRNYIRKATEYIAQYYRKNISIPDIADYVGVSPIYLTKLFKLSTGKTLSESLNYYRIQRSLKMLTDTSDTINTISEAVGYSDVRSYIRFFKKFYHMTPGEYRKQQEQNF